jgi:hypothetical protein
MPLRAPWIAGDFGVIGSARAVRQLEVLNLRDFKLPLLNEPALPAYAGGVYTQPVRSRSRIERAGGLLLGNRSASHLWPMARMIHEDAVQLLPICPSSH